MPKCLHQLPRRSSEGVVVAQWESAIRSTTAKAQKMELFDSVILKLQPPRMCREIARKRLQSGRCFHRPAAAAPRIAPSSPSPVAAAMHPNAVQP
jgi:hypothetical protein